MHMQYVFLEVQDSLLKPLIHGPPSWDGGQIWHHEKKHHQGCGTFCSMPQPPVFADDHLLALRLAAAGHCLLWLAVVLKCLKQRPNTRLHKTRLIVNNAPTGLIFLSLFYRSDSSRTSWKSPTRFWEKKTKMLHDVFPHSIHISCSDYL